MDNFQTKYMPVKYEIQRYTLGVSLLKLHRSFQLSPRLENDWSRLRLIMDF